LTPLPNLILAQASNAEELQDLLYTAFQQKHPFAVRFPKGNTKKCEAAPKEITIGSWVKYHDDPNNKVAVLTYGEDVERILEKVTVNQLPVTVINCRFFKPMDEAILMELSQRNLFCIVYEMDMKVGGLGEHILGYMNETKQPLAMKIFGIPDEYIDQGSERLLRRDLQIDLNTLMEEIQKHTV
jgi:Deoxyxylulose-5-phosphate synthase